MDIAKAFKQFKRPEAILFKGKHLAHTRCHKTFAIPFDECNETMWFEMNGFLYIGEHTPKDYSGTTFYNLFQGTVKNITVEKHLETTDVYFVGAFTKKRYGSSAEIPLTFTKWSVKINEDTGYLSIGDMQQYENKVVPKLISFRNQEPIKDLGDVKEYFVVGTQVNNITQEEVDAMNKKYDTNFKLKKLK